MCAITGSLIQFANFIHNKKQTTAMNSSVSRNQDREILHKLNFLQLNT